MKYALITIYDPAQDVAKHVERIAQQVDGVYLCDNSSVSNYDVFAPLTEQYRIGYLWFSKNLGLSGAFNRCLTTFKTDWQQDDFLIFFDQDSAIEEGHVDTLIAKYLVLEQRGVSVGCLGPAYFNTSSGQVEKPKSRRKIAEELYQVSSIITSSMVTRYGTLAAVGFWNEHVFLDMADWDLCWRICAAGKVCCMTDAVVLHHSIGLGEKRVGLLRLRVGAPFREYYQIRESLYLLGKAYTPLKYRVRFLAMLFIRSPLHVLLLEQRCMRMRYIGLGIRDFLKKKTGVLDEAKVGPVDHSFTK